MTPSGDILPACPYWWRRPKSAREAVARGEARRPDKRYYIGKTRMRNSHSGPSEGVEDGDGHNSVAKRRGHSNG